MRARDCFGGLPCARKIAAINHRERLVCKRAADRFGLGDACGVEFDVQMSLNATVSIPSRLAMSDQTDAGSGHLIIGCIGTGPYNSAFFQRPFLERIYYECKVSLGCPQM